MECALSVLIEDPLWLGEVGPLPGAWESAGAPHLHPLSAHLAPLALPSTDD